MKLLLFNNEFEATFDPNGLPGDVKVMIRRVYSGTVEDAGEEVLWQQRYRYVHGQETRFTGWFREVLLDYLEAAVVATAVPSSNTKFVILQGVEEGNRFFTSWKNDGENYTLLADAVAYRILAYTETVEAAQIFLYGKIYEA